MSILFTIVGGLTGLLLLGFGVASLREKEPRAARIALGGGGVFLLAWFGFGLLFPQWTLPAAMGLMALALVTTLLLLYPMGDNHLPVVDEAKTVRLDEREIMFARARMKEGSEPFRRFYEELRPDLAEVDGELRKLPGLGEPGGRYYEEKDSAYFNALFDYIEEVHHLGDVTTPRRAEPMAIDADEATKRIKSFARHLGAVEVGIAELQPHHVYSNIGRGQGTWGDPIDLDHRYIIVFTVEMDHQLFRNAPMTPAITESAAQYLSGTVIATSLATYCSRLGYRARAHVDGNYRVLVTAAAVDAGLGEIGRLGLLITPSHGPRVRLAAVTTDLPLVPDRPRPFGVQDFCEICRKCAHCCPGQAIPHGERREVNGYLKWQASQEDCFRYWLRVGTDCGLCIAVCPYGKPATIFHNVVRQTCTANPLARRLAHHLDNLFYGRRPRHTDLPDWFASD